jgi:methanogenic corrinoid protein MtbC1
MSHSGPLGIGSGSGGLGKTSHPPNLARFSNDPIYDLAAMVHLVGVRPMILWSWEQQLGIPAPARLTDEASGNVRRYSERDLIASLWLRDQILNGVEPTEAAARLVAAQEDRGRAAAGGAKPQSGELRRESVPGNRLGGDDFRPVRAAAPTRPLNQADLLIDPTGTLSGTLFGGTSIPSGRPAPAMPPPTVPPPAVPLTTSTSTAGPLGAARSGAFPVPTTMGPPDARGAEPFDAGASLPGPRATAVSQPRYSSVQVSRPLGAPLSGPLQRPEQGRYDERASATAWPAPGSVRVSGGPAMHGRDLRLLVPQLVYAFANLDTSGANHILNEAISARSVESVCINLLQPALARVMDLWASRQMSTPEERFATNYVRAHLFSIFHRTPERTDGPLAFVGSGPREQNETGALMLAAFWRRAGMRVVYLGPDMDGNALVEEARTRRPTLIALWISTPQRVRSLARLAKQIAQMEGSRPMLGFYGPIFLRNPELQRKVPGVYLGDDAATATFHLTNLLGAEHIVPHMR